MQLWTLAPHIPGDSVRGFDLDAPTSGVLCDFVPQRIQRVGTDPHRDSDAAPSAHDVSSDYVIVHAIERPRPTDDRSDDHTAELQPPCTISCQLLHLPVGGEGLHVVREDKRRWDGLS